VTGAWTGLLSIRVCSPRHPSTMIFRWVSLGRGLTIRSQAPNARRRKPAHFDHATGPPMCRTRAGVYRASMNSASFASQETAQNQESAGRAGCGVVGRPGLEPGTYGLKVRSSAN
jgi:hypothetical protein